MRVAVRRWRVTLPALAPFMPEGSRRSAANELRWVADALSEARNLDVFASAGLAPARRPPRDYRIRAPDDGDRPSRDAGRAAPEVVAERKILYLRSVGQRILRPGG